MSFEFTKDNIDTYLKAVAKEYRKRAGKGMPAEIVLIGGASVMINYGFRQATNDIDAMIESASAMKDAINAVGDKFGLPNGWLNADFKNTGSYSSRIPEFSVYYKTYSNVLQIRMITGEYLVAMKLRSGRQYKKDLSDIIGILEEHQKRGEPIQLEQIKKAVTDLYGSWDVIPETSRRFIEDVMRSDDLEKVYKRTVDQESRTKESLIAFDQSYPGVTNESNVDSIIAGIRKRQERETPPVPVSFEEQLKKAHGRQSSEQRKDKNSKDIDI